MLGEDTYVPDHKRVVVLTSERSEVLLISGEGKILDHFLVEFESLDHLQSVEVPNDDVSLHTPNKVSKEDPI